MGRARWIAAALAISTAMVTSLPGCDPSPDTPGASASSSAPAVPPPMTPAAPSTTMAPRPTAAPRPPSVDRHLALVQTITGDISPKSVSASGSGLVSAQNMIYKHTVTVYDRNGKLVSTISDSVRPSDFGIAGRTAVVRGGPVEADYTSDGAYAYASNYSMFGPGYAHPGDDVCGPSSGIDTSFVYRIDMVIDRGWEPVLTRAVTRFKARLMRTTVLEPLRVAYNVVPSALSTRCRGPLPTPRIHVTEKSVNETRAMSCVPMTAM